MSPETRQAICEHALAEYPRECCGLVVSIKGRECYVPCRNMAATANDHFMLSHEDYAAAEDRGDILTIVHSHPDVPARPSEADRVGCEAHGLPWVIVSAMPGDAGPEIASLETILPSGYLAPFVGREWSHGVLDCWGLCKDWYAREMGVELPSPPRADGWWDDGQSNLYSDEALTEAGFGMVASVDGLKIGDLILMQIRSRNLVPNHAAIYIGNGHILHHLHGRLSRRDVYGGYWLECTRSVWRLRESRDFALGSQPYKQGMGS